MVTTIWRIAQIPFLFFGISMIWMFIDKSISGTAVEWSVLEIGVFFVTCVAAFELRIRELKRQKSQIEITTTDDVIVAYRNLFALELMAAGTSFLFMIGVIEAIKDGFSLVSGFLIVAGLSGVFIWYRAFRDRHKPRLRIDKEGIESCWFGKIPWIDIRILKLKKYDRTFFLILKMKNIQRYTKRLSDPKAWLLSMNNIQSDSLLIPLSGLDVAEDDFYQAALKQHEQYRKKHNIPMETGDEDIDAHSKESRELFAKLGKVEDPEEALVLLEHLKETEHNIKQAQEERNKRYKNSNFNRHYYGKAHPSLIRKIFQNLLFVVMAGVVFGFFVDFSPSSDWQTQGFYLSGMLSAAITIYAYWGIFTKRLKLRIGYSKLMLATIIVFFPIFIFVFIWMATIHGAPALYTKYSTIKYKQIHVVKEEGHSRRSCDYRLKGGILETAMPPYLCINESLFMRLPSELDIILKGKQSYFGYYIEDFVVLKINTE